MVSIGIPRRMRGFTLINMSIVLVVIGLLLSGGLLAISRHCQTKVGELTTI